MKDRVLRYIRRLVFAERKLTSSQIIVLVFICIILLGAGLLSLPISVKPGVSITFLDALFTATSATCVTGLAIGDTYQLWSGFGQVIILGLIQIGGLGFMSVVALGAFLFRKRIGMRQRLVIAQGFGLNELEGAVRIIRHVLIGTFAIELIGAVILTCRFMTDYPFWTALKWGVFHAVSAFCNAGFDLMGEFMPGSSLIMFAVDPVVNLTIMALVIIGGLGFFVWEDLWNYRSRRKLSVHTKMVLLISGFLILLGWGLFAVAEWTNDATIGSFSPSEKILVSLFQSVSPRTAGFATIDQASLTDVSKMMTMTLMFIGGSSGSTAGGVKTVTVGVLFLAALYTARGKKEPHVFGRTISREQINQALSVFLIMMGLAAIGSFLLCFLEQAPFLDCAYETVSALATVGLSTGLTGELCAVSKIILIIYMFFGRVGVMTISLGFLAGGMDSSRFQYAYTQVLIG
ncbi:MAG: potassium uptake protein, TrkH family [Ruminococcaceae bacterium]|nr:potassium uptake protein, TrkH family [Oscillospiraceae bacterium]